MNLNKKLKPMTKYVKFVRWLIIGLIKNSIIVHNKLDSDIGESF